MQKSQIDSALVAADYRKAMKGKREDAKIEEVARQLVATTNPHFSVKGTVEATHVGVQISLVTTDMNPTRTFTGSGAGAFVTDGKGVVIGDVYSPDFDKLFNNTKTFEVTAAAVYFCVVFFDGNGNSLGNLQVGAVSKIIGEGGGQGVWM